MTTSYIGDTIYVANGNPATKNVAGFEAMTWVKADGVQQLPQLGVTHAGIDVPDLQTGFTGALKASGSGKDSQMAFREVKTDAGQILLVSQANDQAGLLSVKIVTGSGADQAPVSGDPVEYAQGYCHSHEKNQGDDSTHRGFNVSFKQTDFTVEATEPA